MSKRTSMPRGPFVESDSHTIQYAYCHKTVIYCHKQIYLQSLRIATMRN